MYHFVYEYYQIKDYLHKKKRWRGREKTLVLNKVLETNKKNCDWIKIRLLPRIVKDQGVSKQNKVCMLTGRPRGVINPFLLKRQIFKRVLMENNINNVERKKK